MAEQGRPRGEMTLIDHLDELRTTLIQAALVVVAAGFACWFVSGRLLDLLTQPMVVSGNNVYFHAPVEAFLTRLKISLVCGVFAVLPLVLLRVYRFVAPGLYQRERKVVAPVVIVSVGLFYTGVVFAFTVMIPLVVRFMLSFATPTMQPLIGIGPYFEFVSRLCLAFGLVFELPMVVLLLSSLGVVSAGVLWRGWRWATVIIFTASAILTPPDVLSQLLMAGPVLLLYVGSVAVAKVLERRRRGRELPGDVE